MREATAPRISFDELVSIQVPATGVTLSGQARNLSCGGIYICTQELLPEATTVKLCFPLPGEETLAIESTVVRRVPAQDSLEPAGMALRFRTLPPHDAGRIRQFISQRLPAAPADTIQLSSTVARESTIIFRAMDDESCAPAAPQLMIDEEIDPVCNVEFAQHSRILDRKVRTEHRAVIS